MKKTWQGHSGRVVTKKNKYNVIDCKSCGFKHIIPLPKEKQVTDFYKNSFYENYWSDYIKNNVKEVEWRNIEYNEKYDLLENFLPNKKQRKLLDVGSGPGLFLKKGIDRGWMATGIEPGKRAWKYSTVNLHLKVHNTFFNEKNYKKFGLFHVVHLNNVLEHLLKPKLILSLISKILKPDGLICITVPNDFNPFQEIVANYYKKDKWWVDIKEHLNYFDLFSLTKLLKNTGIIPIYSSSSFPLEIFLLMGDDYISNPALGKKIHAKRKQFEIALYKSGKLQLKKDLYRVLAKLRIGRQITIVGRKNS